MTLGTLSPMTRGAGLLSALLALACLGLYLAGQGHSLIASVAGLSALAGLFALRPLVPAERMSHLYFAFAILGLMLFFVHETYAYRGTVRLFPLIVGYAGILLALMDIVSTTETRPGRWITRIFGAALEDEHIISRHVGREVLIFAAMAAAVGAVYLFGFLIVAPFFVALWMRFGGAKSLKTCFYGAVGTFLFIYLMFEVGLNYDLYRGILIEAWLRSRY